MYLYGFARGLVKITFSLIYRIRVEGLENVPETGGAIVCANHFNARDPMIVGITMKRPISYMAKEELFHNKLLAWIITGMGVFPVKRGQPDRAALKRSIDTLQSGTCFGIFPEGTRQKSGKLGKAEPGTAYLALKSGAPVIPVGITSTYKLFSPIIVRYGKPVDLDAYRGAKLTSEAMEAASNAIMAAIGLQLEPPVQYVAAAAQDDHDD
ncbi:MAG TPA: lysophospholipid acyltransferase family protein [Symbiobacteriaceae bacterium]|nr:lysophospholipid acyltransferase family protein [Symbiobacteriaceae bacterium]